MVRTNRPNGERRRNAALDERRFRSFAAWSKGERVIDTAAREGVHHGQISRDIDTVLRQLHGRNLQDADKHRMEMLGKIAHMEAEMLAAWERSKHPRERNRQKVRQQPGKPKTPAPGEKPSEPAPIETTEAEQATERRDGNPRFVERLESLWRLRCQLLGLLQTTISLELDERLKTLEQRAKERGHEIA